LPTETIQLLPDGRGISGRSHFTTPFEKTAGGGPTQQKDLGTLKKQLSHALAPEILRREVTLKATHEGLVISLREVGFFDSGSAQLRPASEMAVQRIAEELSAQPNNIRIEGHTDNVPIHNSRFVSNWELSTARATELIQLFITRYNFPPNRLSAGGYAEFHPVASNDSEDGKAQNRRVDIVVLASAPEGFASIASAISPQK